MEPLKRKRGGQPVDEEERLIGRSIRLKREHWAKVDAGGMDWLRDVIERAKPPPAKKKAG